MHPWPLDEIVYPDLNHKMTNQNFAAVKVGDVNNSAVSNAMVRQQNQSTSLLYLLMM